MSNNNNGMSPAVEHTAYLNGFGYDLLTIIGQTLQRVLAVTGCELDKYNEYKPASPLMNDTMEIVAVGVHIECGGVHVPCLFRRQNGDWGWSRDLIINDKLEVYWNGGHYTNDRDRTFKQFLTECTAVVWHTREYDREYAEVMRGN